MAAGDNPEHLRNEAAFAHLCGTSPIDASSGKQHRHRLNRSGDRQANSALWHAGATGKHPRWVYLRESQVTPALDGWLLRHFDPENIDATIAAMVAAQAPDDAAAARAEAARRKIGDCDSRLASYRRALEKGADAELVGTWLAEVKAERLEAEREIGETVKSQPLSDVEIRALVEAVRAGLMGLAKAPPAQKAAMYATMGLRLTYHPETGELDIESRPDACTQVRVGGGTNSFSYPALAA